MAEVQRAQAELQSEAEAPAEGEDAIVEEAAVTGGVLKPCLSVLDRVLICSEQIRCLNLQPQLLLVEHCEA